MRKTIRFEVLNTADLQAAEFDKGDPADRLLREPRRSSALRHRRDHLAAFIERKEAQDWVIPKRQG